MRKGEEAVPPLGGLPSLFSRQVKRGRKPWPKTQAAWQKRPFRRGQPSEGKKAS